MEQVLTHSPLCWDESPLERRVKAAVGTVLSRLLPARVARLQLGESPISLDGTDRLMVAALVERYMRQREFDALGVMHRWSWRGLTAPMFNRGASARYVERWLPHHSRIYAPIQTLLDLPPTRFHTCCEIGSGSGMVLADLRRRLHGPREFIGLDLNVDQVKAAARRYARIERLDFVAGDATEWIPQNAGPGWMYLSHDGVLGFFTPRMLLNLLGHIADLGHPSAFALVEPLPQDFDLLNTRDSQVWGADATFVHPYPRLFRSAGWRVRWHREFRLPHGRYLMLLAETRQGGRPRAVQVSRKPPSTGRIAPVR